MNDIVLLLGIHGWFPLHAPVTSDDGGWESVPEFHPTTFPDTPPLEEYVGGVELSISFTNKDDRRMILSSALKMGWKAPQGCSIDFLSLVPASPTEEEEMGAEEVGLDGGGGERWRLDINVNSLSVPLDAVAMPLPTVKNPTYKYCFLRYRFMDNSESLWYAVARFLYCSTQNGSTLFVLQVTIAVVEYWVYTRLEDDSSET